MDDNEEVTCEETFEEIDVCVSKIESQTEDQNDEDVTTEYLDLDLEVDTIPDTEQYYPFPPKPCRGRRKKSLEVKSQSQASLLKSNYSTTAELKLGPKYRPIRPKPYQPSFASRSKMLGVSSAVNVSTLSPSNRFIVTTSLPYKDKIKDSTILNNLNSKTSSYMKPVNGNISGTSMLVKGNNNDKSSVSNSTNVINKKNLCNTKTQTKSKGSIELFFESMAQTVINLPMHVQAEIKMEICKLVAMAEIKYSLSQAKQNYKNG